MCTVHKVINPKSNINMGGMDILDFGIVDYIYRATFAISLFDPIVVATNVVCYLRLGSIVRIRRVAIH